jgi:hypothetical protein
MTGASGTSASTSGSGDSDGPWVLDLGHSVTARWTSWGRYERVGVVESHPRRGGKSGERCELPILFDLPGVRYAFNGEHIWSVERWQPLTLEPAVTCSTCGHEGYIRDGRWLPVE